MKKYILNYYVPDLVRFDKKQYNGRGWSTSFEPAQDYVKSPPLVDWSFDDGDEVIPGGPVMVVVIHARDYAVACRAARLIIAAHCLLEGSTLLLPSDDLIPYPADGEQEDELDEVRLMRVRATGFLVDDTPLACMIASRASHRRSSVFAVFKLLWSLQMYSTVIVDLDPHLSSTVLRKVRTPEECIRFAQAITLAYGAIEELGLTVQASQQKPSRPCGNWNPEVREDLEKRLRKAGVDLTDPMLWTLRGPKTRLEQGRPTKNLGRASWACGKVRDEDVDICDAIADISWLRSRVSAHKSSELVDLLSPYDVANAQYLARRLILDALRIPRE